MVTIKPRSIYFLNGKTNLIHKISGENNPKHEA